MKMIKNTQKIAILAASLLFTYSAQATIVQFQTSLGDIEVNLYDEGAPLTVENFLFYLESNAYMDSLIQRTVTDYVVQGGGFNFISNQIDKGLTVTSPLNEPVYSNVKGTIAMAKLASDPNSATSQWFFNLVDNSAYLDGLNGGFTVFGEVINGMDVVEAIAALPRYSLIAPDEDLVNLFVEPAFMGAFSSVPLVGDFSDLKYSEFLESFLSAPIDHLVMINSIVVLDSALDTAKDLEPQLNTANKPKKKKKKFGSTDISLLSLLLLLGAGLRMRRAVKHAI